MLATSGDSVGGPTSYRVRNGTATGCEISGATLRVKSAGTCVVIATKAAGSSTPAVSSPATIISFHGTSVPTVPISITVTFPGSSSALSSADRVALSAWAKKLTKLDVVACLGYAGDDSALALRRAKVVATYLTSTTSVRVNVEAVSHSADNKVIVRHS